MFLLSKAIGKDFFIAQLKKQARKKPYDTSKYVGNAVWGNGGDICIYERTLFDKYVLVDFEGKKYRAPQGYDQFLRHIYGDYMKFPKEQDRKPHHGYYAIKNPEVVDEHNM